MGIIQRTMWATEEIKDSRTLSDILAYTMSELGELTDEVLVVEGKSTKRAGEDGVVGEAVDAIICLLDMIHAADSTVTEQQIERIIARKMEKWKSSVGAITNKT